MAANAGGRVKTSADIAISHLIEKSTSQNGLHGTIGILGMVLVPSNSLRLGSILSFHTASLHKSRTVGRNYAATTKVSLLIYIHQLESLLPPTVADRYGHLAANMSYCWQVAISRKLNRQIAAGGERQQCV